MTAKNEVTSKPAKLWTSDYVLAFVSCLFMFFAFNSLIPTLPIYVEIYEGISWATGFPMAALTIGAVLIRPVAGWALDAYGRKAILLGGVLLFLLPSLSFIGMLSAFALIGLRLVQGVGWGIGNTAINTVASDIVPRERMGEGMSIFTATMGLSLAFAPALGLWLQEQFSFPILFTVVSVFIAISLLLALFIEYPEIEKKKEKIKWLTLEKNSLVPALVVLFYTINVSSIMSFVAVYAELQGITSSGIFFTATAITTLAVRPLVGYLVDKKGDWGYNLCMVMGTAGMVLAMVLLAHLTTVAHLVLGGLLHGFGFGIIQPTILARCLQLAPEKSRGAATATYWTTFDIGVALGSALWSLVVPWTGYYWMFLFTIVPVIIGFILYLTKITYAPAKESTTQS